MSVGMKVNGKLKNVDLVSKVLVETLYEFGNFEKSDGFSGAVVLQWISKMSCLLKIFCTFDLLMFPPRILCYKVFVLFFLTSCFV